MCNSLQVIKKKVRVSFESHTSNCLLSQTNLYCIQQCLTCNTCALLTISNKKETHEDGNRQVESKRHFTYSAINSELTKFFSTKTASENINVEPSYKEHNYGFFYIYDYRRNHPQSRNLIRCVPLGGGLKFSITKSNDIAIIFP